MMGQLEVVILTHNEERNLPSCLSGVAALNARCFVVDSGSTDATVSLAAAAGCEVITHPFRTHSEQWRWALQNLPLRTPWVLALDADQTLTPELARSIEQFVINSEDGVDGAYLCRRQVFRGRWIRFGGYYPKFLLKLFRRSAVSLGEDLVDHHFLVSGRTAVLQGDMIESNQKEDEISVWIAKHNRYATLQAQEELGRHLETTGDLFGNPDARTIYWKSVWRKLPLYIRPFLYFGYRYIVRLGFLDGKQGFVFHFLQAFWYRLLVDINIDELQSLRRQR